MKKSLNIKVSTKKPMRNNCRRLVLLLLLPVFALMLGSCADGQEKGPLDDVEQKPIIDGSVADDNGAEEGSRDQSSQNTNREKDVNKEISFIFREKNDGGTLAVWWWNVNHFFDTALRDQYLDFLQMNRINEIYLCYPNMDMDRMVEIVRICQARGMGVSLLSGDCWWIDPDNHGENAVIDEFLEYQSYAPEDAKLLSLHLDVEPHQRDDFSTESDLVLQNYASMVKQVSDVIHASGERIEWDIPFWFDNYTVNDENGKELPLLQHLSNNADTLCLMSYRDSAKDILSVSEAEIAVCLSGDCKVILGIETHSSEGDHVSFMEEGKHRMYFEMKEVYQILKSRMPKEKYGMAVHYLDTWFPLKVR